MKFKEWWKTFVKSCSMGLGMIPGVSAGTMAVLVGIYDDLIDAIASMRKHFKAIVDHALPDADGSCSLVRGDSFSGPLWL
jgi:uncharacterized membrane protein